MLLSFSYRISSFYTHTGKLYIELLIICSLLEAGPRQCDWTFLVWVQLNLPRDKKEPSIQFFFFTLRWKGKLKAKKLAQMFDILKRYDLLFGSLALSWGGRHTSIIEAHDSNIFIFPCRCSQERCIYSVVDSPLPSTFSHKRYKMLVYVLSTSNPAHEHPCIIRSV